MDSKEKQDRQIKKAMGALSGLAVSMVFSVLIGFLGGRYLDSKLGTGSTFLIVGTLLGIITAFKRLYDISKKDWGK